VRVVFLVVEGCEGWMGHGEVDMASMSRRWEGEGFREKSKEIQESCQQRHFRGRGNSTCPRSASFHEVPKGPRTIDPSHAASVIIKWKHAWRLLRRSFDVPLHSSFNPFLYA
jgi:hypothetical protein